MIFGIIRNVTLLVLTPPLVCAGVSRYNDHLARNGKPVINCENIVKDIVGEDEAQFQKREEYIEKCNKLMSVISKCHIKYD